MLFVFFEIKRIEMANPQNKKVPSVKGHILILCIPNLISILLQNNECIIGMGMHKITYN